VKLYIKYDINEICKKILQEQLDRLELSYVLIGYSEVEIKEDISNDKLKELHSGLNNYGMEVVESNKSILVQKIKDVIIEMIYENDKLPTSKISAYLADRLSHSYGYIANVFAEVTYTSVENFIILHRIEFAKKLITVNELSFTEISHKLNYSSLAHFCTQFKNTTGLTPSAFKRIIIRRREAAMNNA
jgi:AraC-like DNA-binding protein